MFSFNSFNDELIILFEWMGHWVSGLLNSTPRGLVLGIPGDRVFKHSCELTSSTNNLRIGIYLTSKNMIQIVW